jgi:hypothetical protein
MPSNNERVEFAMKIIKYRELARQVAVDNEATERMTALIPELERKLREIDE